MSDSEQDDDFVSKSQRKREMLALQDLGEKLLNLSESQLEQCQLSADLLGALKEYKRLPNAHAARRRQRQYIGKLMRKVDPAPIEAVLEQQRQQSAQELRRFHQLEETRDRLLEGDDDTLNRLIADYPDLDIQHLRQLIRQAKKEADAGKPLVASRKLFKYLKELM